MWANLARGQSVVVVMIVSGGEFNGGRTFNDLAESREGLVGDDDDGQPSAMPVGGGIL